jgi:hypothetical protein
MRLEFPLLLASLCPALAAPPAAAPRTTLQVTAGQVTAGQATPSQATASESTDAPEARRILHLRNGQTIRVLSRERKGVWEYHGKSGWKELAAGFVESSALESDVLREWSAKKAATPPADLAARAKAGDWALSAGLAVEGLEEMSNVLGFDPDKKEVLDSLAAHADVMSVPAVDPSSARRAQSTTELLRYGASMPAAARELAVLELKKLPRDKELTDVLLGELRSNVVARRSFGALAMRRLVPGEGVKPLLRHAVLDPSDEVRRSASLALRAIGEPGVIVPVVRVLETSPSASLRMNAAEALGDMGYGAAVEPLMMRLMPGSNPGGDSSRLPHSYIFVGTQIAYIHDFDVQVAQNQAVADPQVGVLIEGSVLDAAVAGVHNVDTTVELAEVRNSLEKLTNASPGKNSKAWLAWWQQNSASWRSEDLSRTPRTGETSASAK